MSFHDSQGERRAPGKDRGERVFANPFGAYGIAGYAEGASSAAVYFIAKRRKMLLLQQQLNPQV
jgi:hypothetical protein